MRGISTVVGLVVLLATAITGQDIKPVSPLLETSFSGLPIYFIENRGVYPEEVRFHVQGSDKTLFFTRDGFTFRLRCKDCGWVVKLEFVGANPDVHPRGEDPQQAIFSYFKGPEKDWKTGLPTFAKVVYENLWPGIDLVYKGTVNQLKYEFIVKPGADPGKIRFRYRGATEARVTDAGGVRITMPVGRFEDEPPVAWQEIDGERTPVGASFVVADRTDEDLCVFGFRVGEYDCTIPLVLDPAIFVYCGFIGGSDYEPGLGIAVDAAGNAYMTGLTNSEQGSFPVTAGPDLTQNGCEDAFVAKVNAKGTALVYCGYIGGSGYDRGYSIAVDVAGNAYIAGWVGSDQRTFPVTVGPGLIHSGGNWDAFVAKVNTQGTALVYCGYVGGVANDHGLGIAVDGAGNAYVAGETCSDQKSFPVTAGPDLTYNGGNSDAFVAKVNPRGTAFVYCGFIGGVGIDGSKGIAVDQAGNAYVTGETDSDQKSFPVTAGPDLTFNGGNRDAFVAKVNAQGTALVYCGYVGGVASDHGHGIAVDGAENAYVAGYTGSDQQTFPVTVGPDLTHSGHDDAFVAKVNAQGTGLVYCGYIGGSSSDGGYGIAVDQAGNAYVAGETCSDQMSFPVKVGPDQTYNGMGDAFVAKVNTPGTGLVYCGYIGGKECEYGGHGIAVDGAGNAYVTGDTESDQQTFPVRVGPDLSHNCSWDAFVAKVALTLLEISGTTRPGGMVSLNLTATSDAMLPYQAGSSLGTGPIPIDTRKLTLSPDDVLAVSAGNLWPTIFSGYRGLIDSRGQAKAAINIPDIPFLIGFRLHTAFVTLDPRSPSGIKSISNTVSFSITK